MKFRKPTKHQRIEVQKEEVEEEEVIDEDQMVFEGPEDHLVNYKNQKSPEEIYSTPPKKIKDKPIKYPEGSGPLRMACSICSSPIVLDKPPSKSEDLWCPDCTIRIESAREKEEMAKELKKLRQERSMRRKNITEVIEDAVEEPVKKKRSIRTRIEEPAEDLGETEVEYDDDDIDETEINFLSHECADGFVSRDFRLIDVGNRVKVICGECFEEVEI